MTIERINRLVCDACGAWEDAGPKTAGFQNGSELEVYVGPRLHLCGACTKAVVTLVKNRRRGKDLREVVVVATETVATDTPTTEAPSPAVEETAESVK